MLGRRYWVAVIALCVSACSPSVVWTGRTPNRERRVRIISDGDKQWLEVDGQRRAGHRAIAAASLVMNDDGSRLAYGARRPRGWTVMYRGKAGPIWNRIGDISMSTSGHLAYAAERDGQWHVATTDPQHTRTSESQPFDRIVPGTLVVPDTDGLPVYVAEDDDRTYVVAAGKRSRPWHSVGPVYARASRVAYAGRVNNEVHAVVDGQSIATGTAVQHWTFHAGEVGFAIEQDDGWTVFWRAQTFGPYPDVEAMVPGPGQRLAYVIGRSGQDELFVDGSLVASAQTVYPATIAWDHTGNLVYGIRSNDGTAWLISSFAHGPSYDEIGTVAMAPNRRGLAYTARRGGTWYVRSGARELPAGRHVSTPVFSPDGTRLGYVSQRAGESGDFVVIDGRARRYDLVIEDTLIFSDDNKHWAIIAGDIERDRLLFVVDGKPGQRLEASDIYSAAARMLARQHGETGDLRTDILKRWTRAEVNRHARSNL